MTAKFQKLKEDLKTLEQDDTLSRPVTKRSGTNNGLFRAGLSSPGWVKKMLFAGFMGAFILYAGITYLNPPSVDNPFTVVQNWINQPNEELLTGMGSWMEEMGYTGLDREELIELRQQGVTATFTSRMHDLGYEDLSLEQLVRLRQNDVSSTFAAMMKELEYDLSVEELIELRQHDVTAYFTSNMHDLGYSNISQEELIRLRDTGVQTSEVQTLVEENEELPTIEEIIRYHISNQ